MKYFISKYNNLIKVDGDNITLIPMKSGDPLYEEYVDYLRNEGEVLNSDLYSEEETILINREGIKEVPLWKIRVILKIMDLETAIEGAMELLQEPNKTAAKYILEYGTAIDRHSPTVLFIQSSLGLTDLQVDDIFIQANAITL